MLLGLIIFFNVKFGIYTCLHLSNSGRAVRFGLRWLAELLYGVQQPTHRTFPELFTTDGRRCVLRHDHVASERHHKSVQLRVATEEYHKVHARQLESRRLHIADTAVHPGNARQQNLQVKTIFYKR